MTVPFSHLGLFLKCEMNNISRCMCTNDISIINVFYFFPQVSPQHRFKHFSFQDSQEPPPSVSISSKLQAKVIIPHPTFCVDNVCLILYLKLRNVFILRGFITNINIYVYVYV